MRRLVFGSALALAFVAGAALAANQVATDAFRKILAVELFASNAAFGVIANPIYATVGGKAASGSAVVDNPVLNGGRAQSAEPTVVANGQAVDAAYDLAGKAIVLPYANPENFVSGVITTAMTGTTSTSLVSAPASGLRNYITACTVSNAHATVGTDMILQDGSGGTTIWNIPAAAVYGGAHITFPTPLRQPTTATALYVANVTTGASTKAACSGYKGA
jgi:hypothetical protein